MTDTLKILGRPLSDYETFGQLLDALTKERGFHSDAALAKAMTQRGGLVVNEKNVANWRRKGVQPTGAFFAALTQTLHVDESDQLMARWYGLHDGLHAPEKAATQDSVSPLSSAQHFGSPPILLSGFVCVISQVLYWAL